jgi:drug/metabolite transporter, DME family
MSRVLPAAASGHVAGRGGLFLIVLAAMLWGTAGVSTRAIYGLAETTAVSVAFLRLALSLPVLGGTSAAVLGRTGWSVSPRHLGLMAVSGVMLALYQLLFFAALERVGVAVATLVTLCSAPVLVALLSTVLLGERPTRRLGLAAGLAILGTLLLVSPAAGTTVDGLTTVGLLLALGSAFGYALVTIVSRRIAGAYHPLLPVTVAAAVGTVALLPVLLLDGPHLAYPVVGWLLLLYLGVGPTAVGYVLFTRGMRTTAATVASVVTMVEPLTAAVLAWLLFDEQLGPLALVGAGMLLGAVLLLTRE